MKKLLKIFTVSFLIVFILLVCLLFTVTNTYITSNYLLTAVNKTLETDIKAKTIKLSLLHSFIEVDSFSFYKKDSEFSIDHGEKIYIKFELLDLFSGKINISQIEIDNLNITINCTENSKSILNSANLARFLRENINSTSLFSYDINSIKIRDLNLTIKKKNEMDFSLKKADIYIPFIRENSNIEVLLTNGDFLLSAPEKLTLHANKTILKIKTHLMENLIPEDIAITLTAKDIQGYVNKKHITTPKLNVTALIKHNGNKFDIKKLNISEFAENNSKISDITLSGYFDIEPFSFNLKINVNPISSTILNSFSNYFLNKTYKNSVLQYSGILELKEKHFLAEGNVFIKNLDYSSFNKKNKKPLNLQLIYKFDFDRQTKELNINKFGVDIKSAEKEIIKINLKNNLSLTIDKNRLRVLSKDSRLSLKINDLNIEWLKNYIPSSLIVHVKKITGNISTELDIVCSRQNILKANIKTYIKNLSIKTGKNITINNINIIDKSAFTINNLLRISLDKNKFYISQADKLLLSGSITGNYNNRKDEGGISINISKLYQDTIELLPITTTIKNKIAEYLKPFRNYHLKIESKIKLHLKKEPIVLDSLTIELQNKSHKAASIELKTPLRITSLSRQFYLITDPFNFNLNFYNFDLSLFNTILNKYQVSVDDGTLSGNFNFATNDIPQEVHTRSVLKINNRSATSFSKKNVDNKDANSDLDEYKYIKIDGNYNAKKLSLTYKYQKFKNIEFEQSADIIFHRLGIINLNSVNTLLKINNNKALSFILSGAISFINKSYHLNLKKIYLSVEQLNNLPIDIAKKTLGIKSLNMTGNMDISKEQNNKALIIKNKLKGKDLSFYLRPETPEEKPFDCTLSSEIKLNKRHIMFNSLNFNLTSAQNNLGYLNGTGLVYTPLTHGTSELKLKFSDIKLKNIISAVNNMAETNIINTNGIDFNIDLAANNVSYGNELKLNLNTNISKIKDKFSIRPIMADINGTNIFATFNSTTGKHSQDSFNATCSFSDMDIVPFLKTYRPLMYDNATGIITDFSLNLSGEKLSEESLRKLLNGNVKTSLSHLSFNDNLADYDILRLLFLPFEILTQVEHLLTISVIPGFFHNVINYSKKIFSNAENLRFRTAILDMNIDDGIVNLKKCYFKGDDDSFDSLKFDGTISLNKELDLNAFIKLDNYVTLPLHIAGKISSPYPDVIGLTSFIKQTILSLFRHDTLYVEDLPEKF